jgi:diaminohydroxyphosphoribosylaminopyrimidine deaminase / 5-amino-6-(5-phosphoribosylamino)uracil reductase
MAEVDDIKFMYRCLELACKAEGMTYPNPMVGSVIVHNGEIIGEGYHLKAGEPHAEVIAIKSVRNRSLLKSSILYVNLEPCSHHGRTPPCADLIVSNRIRKVVVGSIDTSSKVSGRGIEYLREAGCEVITGVIDEECRWLNRRFFTFHEKKRPYIILKWAQSADGFIDIERTDSSLPGPNWITGNSEKVLVHKWRASEQSILVGAATIRNDNAKLNVREWSGNEPLKFILSKSGNLSGDFQVFKKIGRIIVFTNNEDSDIQGAERVILKGNSHAAEEVVEYLYEAEIESLFIEGGAKTLEHFIDCGLWDEARIFFGKALFKAGIRAPQIKGELISEEKYSGSLLKRIANK